MPYVGDRKLAFCAICGFETEWEYTLVQKDDGLFGIQNLIDPELHQVKLWRCLYHTTPEGRTKLEFHKATPHHHLPPAKY